jgi:DNA polymerase family A
VAEKKSLEIGDIKPPKQLLQEEKFYVRDNVVYCVRPLCEGCKYDPVCQREEMITKIGPGINIREAFRVRPGFKWACIDFAGIELRVAALLSGEPVWVQAFQDNRDLHQEMAKIMFRTDEPDKAQRDIAKMGNFGNLYLSGVDTFWQLTTLSYNEAAIAWTKWWAAVPTYEKWTKNQEEYYKKHGHVWTFFRRKREMKAMIAKADGNLGTTNGKKVSGKKMGHGFCKRTACNSPIQGSSADLLKMAMTRVDSFLTKQKLRDDVKMMLTVHDELDFEIRENPAMFEILRDIGREMTLTPKGRALPTIPNWNIPLKVDIEIGDNWGNLVGIDDLDPATKDLPKPENAPPKRDEVTLLVSGITTEDADKLHMAIFQAAHMPNVVKVPLLIKMGDRAYSLTALEKVSEGYLRRLVQGIPGVKVL